MDLELFRKKPFLCDWAPEIGQPIGRESGKPVQGFMALNWLLGLKARLGLVVVAFVVFCIRTVVAGAGVFEVIAGGAIFEVEVETNGFCFGIGSRFHLENDGDVESFR